MPVTFADKRFAKIGKGVPQTHQMDQDGKLLYEDGTEKDTEGKLIQVPVMGNEQYTARQIVPGSFADPKLEVNLTSALEACGKDHKVFFESFRIGWNELEQQKAAGTDPYSRTFKGLVKMGYTDAEAQKVVDGLKKDRNVS